MRILQLCTRFPPAPGGVETHVLEISKRMRALGHDVEVLTSDLYSETPFVRLAERTRGQGKGEGRQDREREVEGVPVRRFKAHTAGGEAHYLLYPGMRAAVLRESADIVHAHSYGYYQTNLLPLVRKLRRTPTVLTAHFHPPWSTWGGAKRRGLRKVYDSTLGRTVLNGVDIVISHTREEVRLMEQNGLDASGGRVRIVPAGIDFGRFREVPDGAPFRRAFSIPPSDRLVLFSGRLAVNKGLLVLAEAAPAVLREHPEARFVLVGEDMGVREKLERRLGELGARERFLFTGHLEDEALFRSAYGACDAFVLPSEYEAFGLVLLEAMASGKPCVASAAGGMPEVLGKEDGRPGETPCGLLVGHGDAGALAGAVSRLLGDGKLRQAMGAAGRERVRTKFNWDSVTHAILEIYRELGNQGGGPPPGTRVVQHLYNEKSMH